MERNYATQMDAARRGIVTPELKKVAEKEYMAVEDLILIIIKLRAGDYFSCRQVAFRIKIEECIGLVFQIIDIPYHLVSFISP